MAIAAGPYERNTLAHRCSPIVLSNPDPLRYPAAEGVPVLEEVAGPGDTVFLTVAWWHEVSAR